MEQARSRQPPKDNSRSWLTQRIRCDMRGFILGVGMLLPVGVLVAYQLGGVWGVVWGLFGIFWVVL